MAPFIVSGIVDVCVGDSFTSDTGRRAISRAISRLKPRELQEEDGRSVFRGGLLRLPSSLNLLAAVTEGEVAMVMQGPKLRVSYTIALQELFVAVLLLSTALGLALAFTGGSWWVAGLLFVWMFGMNVLLLRFRFSRFLRRAELSEFSEPTH